MLFFTLSQILFFSSSKSCPQERFQVKNPPHTYLQKLRSYLDPAVTRKVSDHRRPPDLPSRQPSALPPAPSLRCSISCSGFPLSQWELLLAGLTAWETRLRNSQSRQLFTRNRWLVGDLPLARPCPAPTFLWRREVEIRAVLVVEPERGVGWGGGAGYSESNS